MTFSNSVSTCFKKYFTFSGRAPRSEYWWFQLFAILGSIVFGIVDGLTFGGGYNDSGVFGSIFGLAMIVPTVSVTCRRLHDINRTGWWQLGWVLVIGLAYLLIFGMIMTSMASLSDGATGFAMIAAFVLLSVATILWPLIWLASTGTATDNKYGPNPLA